jgi:holliday junction DNA helicase RuvA
LSLVSSIHGAVVNRGPDSVVIDLGGLGIRVHCSPQLAARTLEGSQLELHTYLHLRDDVMALYGFESKAELTTFEQLIGVSGVGPKVGLALLSTVGADRLALAIGNSDLATLTRVPGIGKKTAERIVVELREKFRDYQTGEAPALTPDEDVSAALVALGYSATEAAEASRRAGAGSTEERILAALRLMDSR